MSEAMERIVDTFVRLRNRAALEKLRDHHHRLVVDLNRLRSDLNYNSSQSLRVMVDDLAEIDAGLERLDEAPLTK
jgi:thioester reductase-like protein